MRKLLCLILAGLCLLLTACTGAEPVNADTTLWVTYKGARGKVTNDQSQVIFDHSYRQPVLSGPGGVTVINNKLDNSTSAFIYGSGGVQELTEMARMDCRENWFSCYALERSVRVARADSAVISFRYVDYAFTGGVHGYSGEYGHSYDMVTGQQLDLESLTGDAEALKDFCRDYLLELMAGETYEGLLFPNYERYLDGVMSNWLLTDEGLEFIAQPYVIAAYAAGTLRFTVPYDALADYIDAKWLPPTRGHGGGTMTLASGAGDVRFVLDETGEEITLRINGTVYDFSVERLGDYPTADGYVEYVDEQLLYSPQVGSKTITLQAPKDILIRWRSGDGTEHQYTVDGGKLVERENLLELELN